MHRDSRPIAALGLAILLAGCGGDAIARSTTGATATQATVVISPDPTATAATAAAAPTAAAPIAAASPPTQPKPSAPPTSVDGWSSPVAVGIAAGCSEPSAGIDAASRDHVVNTCGGKIFYAMSSQGSSWASSTFSHPAHRLDLEPALAFQGNHVYVAYTQVAVADGGCGDNGLRDVGVYVRQRSLPVGAWSEPRRLGPAADHLMAFRVSGQTIHATVTASRGETFYETLTGPVFHRYPIPGAVGGADLRIGTDGRVRIAYEAAKSIRYGTFKGSRFTSTSVPGSLGGWAPQLLLGTDDQAYLMWIHMGRGGCALEADPRDGTYFATDPSGAWTSRRLSKEPALRAFTLDPRTGTVHALIWDRGLRDYTRDSAGVWHSTRLPAVPASAEGTVLRVDPATGRLLVVYEMSDANGSSQAMFAITKP